MIVSIYGTNKIVDSNKTPIFVHLTKDERDDLKKTGKQNIMSYPPETSIDAIKVRKQWMSDVIKKINGNKLDVRA